MPQTRSCTRFALAIAFSLTGATLGCADHAAMPAPEPSAALPSSTEPHSPAAQENPQESPPRSGEAPSISGAGEPAIESAAALSAPTPELYAQDGLTLRRFALTRAIEDHEPTAADFSFPLEEAPLYAFIDVANTNDEPHSVRVIFSSPSGERMGMVDLGIPSEVSRWRTWAYSRMITEPGQWEAIVETEEGALLGRISFQIEAS